MRSLRRILVGHANSLSAPEFVWSLAAAGFEAHAFVRRGDRAAIGQSRSVVVHEITPVELDSAAAVDDVIYLTHQLGAAALAPLDDAAVWLCNQVTGSLNAKIAGPTGEAAKLALDKLAQIEAAGQAGLSTPITIPIKDLSPFDAAPMLPLILKPMHAVQEDEGHLKKYSGYICASIKEFEDARDRWAGRWPLLVQPLLRGVGEGVFGLATERGVLAWSAHRRVRMMNPHGSGSSACIAITPDESLYSPIERFLRSVHWDGIFMIELLRDSEGKAWFMELNGRSWGSMALARRQGFEYPAWSVHHALEPGFLPNAPVPTIGLLCRHLGRELLYLVYVWRGPKSQAVVDWPGRFAALRDVFSFRRNDCWYNARHGETKTFIADLWITLRCALRQGMKGLKH